MIFSSFFRAFPPDHCKSRFSDFFFLSFRTCNFYPLSFQITSGATFYFTPCLQYIRYVTLSILYVTLQCTFLFMLCYGTWKIHCAYFMLSYSVLFFFHILATADLGESLDRCFKLHIATLRLCDIGLFFYTRACHSRLVRHVSLCALPWCTNFFP